MYAIQLIEIQQINFNWTTRMIALSGRSIKHRHFFHFTLQIDCFKFMHVHLANGYIHNVTVFLNLKQQIF